MAVPSSPNARLFYRAAKQRYDDAAILLRMQRTTGAVYLGYSVECMLKALILASVSRSQELEALAQFRGQQAHSFDWLLRLYRNMTSTNVPEEVLTYLIRVNTWSTNIRYQPGVIDKDDAKQFIDSVEQISSWIEGKL